MIRTQSISIRSLTTGPQLLSPSAPCVPPLPLSPIFRTVHLYTHHASHDTRQSPSYNSPRTPHGGKAHSSTSALRNADWRSSQLGGEEEAVNGAVDGVEANEGQGEGVREEEKVENVGGTGIALWILGSNNDSGNLAVKSLSLRIGRLRTKKERKKGLMIFTSRTNKLGTAK